MRQDKRDEFETFALGTRNKLKDRIFSKYT